MEDEKRLAIFLDQPLIRGDDTVELLAGTQDAEEVVLNLVDLQDADDLEAACAIPNAEHEPAAPGVGKSGDGFIGIFRNGTSSLFELDVGPLVPLEAFDELFFLHRHLLQHHPDPGRLLSLGEAIQMSLETPLQLVWARGRTAGKERGSQVLGPHHHFD